MIYAQKWPKTRFLAANFGQNKHTLDKAGFIDFVAREFSRASHMYSVDELGSADLAFASRGIALHLALVVVMLYGKHKILQTITNFILASGIKSIFLILYLLHDFYKIERYL